MSLKITCACGKTLNVKEEHIGRKIKCYVCHNVIKVEGPVKRPSTEPPSSAPGAQSTECPACAEIIAREAARCPICDEPLGRLHKVPPSPSRGTQMRPRA